MKELEETRKILDDDETILESFKPNKKRFVFIGISFTTILFLLFGGGIFTFGLLGFLNVIHFVNEAGDPDPSGAVPLMIAGCIPLLIGLLSVIGIVARYKRTVYVITNKRIIIRSGFIGVDYKSLQANMIGMINVRVDFLDKLVHPNTGSIIFASPAVPSVNGNGQYGAGTFVFAALDDPYEAYKRIKAHIGQDAGK